MQDHEWRERTDDGVRFYRASRHGKQWRMITSLKHEETWTDLPAPWDESVTEALRDVLWAKYQRNRIAAEAMLEIDQMLPEEKRKIKDPSKAARKK
jgi:hypothetical protein